MSTTAHGLLEQLFDKTYSCASEEGPADVVARENQRLDEERNALKQEYLTSLTTKLYLENLGRDERLWPQLKQKEQEEKAARKEKHEIKKHYDSTAADIYTILESATKDHELLKQKVTQLEEKLNILQTKKHQLESRHCMSVGGVQSAVVKCEQAIQRLEGELTSQRARLTSHDTAITDLTDQVERANIDRHTLTRSEEIVRFLSTLNGFTARLVSPSIVQLEFPSSTSQLNTNQLNRSQLNMTQQNRSQLNASCVDNEEFSLIVTLTLRPESQGPPQLEDVKVNVDHFMVADLIQDTSLRGNIPHLVAAIQHRWNTHFPLLAEIDRLNKTHAIDWIQDQCKLRVLVGNCGNMMFTLNIPQDYPQTRGITLHDSCGVNDVDLQDLPGENATLHDWVIHLEKKYSNYDH